jgi:CBS domain-containing protein
MKVHQIMTRQVACCGPEDSLHHAAHLMWENDCGAIPVIDHDRRVLGMVTDRDACMAAYTQGLPLEAIRVAPVMSRELVCCRPEHDVADVELRMSERQVRRVPVVDAKGVLVGILSINDLSLHAERNDRKGVLDTLASIGRHRHQELAAE